MQHLFSEFKPVTAADWKTQLAKDLKGEDFDSLVWKNENGFDIHPFYTAEDLHLQYQPAFTHAGWEVCVKGKSANARTLNKQLLRDLNSGATAISLHCDDLDLSAALQNIQLNYIHATFYTGAEGLPLLKDYLERNYKAAELNCSVFPEDLNTQQDLTSWIQAALTLENDGRVRTYSVDALPFHNQNCFAYYEVAMMLSLLNAYLGAIPPDKMLAPSFAVKTGVNTDYFIQIAKLRAIRRIWKLMAFEYGISTDLHLIVETSSTNKSVSDVYNNLLRTTVEAMAAVSGGCNELIVTEFDQLFSSGDARSERLAINQQLILKEESYFDKVADVACGSYYIERITDAIAEKALETMKRFEAEGGYFKCLEKNRFNEEIGLQAMQKEEQINKEEQIIIGVNKFKNEKEKIGLSKEDLSRLEKVPFNNPVLKFELEHYFKKHA